MSKKYHINETTGRPNLCHATVRDCPVGGSHYDSKEEARAGYEAAQATAAIQKPMKKTSPEGPDVALHNARPVPTEQELSEERQAVLEELGASPTYQLSVGELLRTDGVSGGTVLRLEESGVRRITVRGPYGSEVSLSTDLARAELGMEARAFEAVDMLPHRVAKRELDSIQRRMRGRIMGHEETVKLFEEELAARNRYRDELKKFKATKPF